MEIDFFLDVQFFPVSTFGFKVDDLHGGDFFRDIGGQRHVSKLINFFSGNACFLQGFSLKVLQAQATLSG